MNIALINAYGYKNIGDEAILESALTFLNKHVKKGDSISVHAEKKDSIPKEIINKYNLKTYQLPYGYAIRSKKEKVNSITKILRFFEIIFFTLFHMTADYFNMKPLPSTGFYAYIKNIKNASSVIGMGGGYFISRSPIKDSFGLFLSLIPVYISKAYKKKILFFFLSLGPFASNIHEKATYQALQKTTIMSRDQITLKKILSLDKYKKIRTFLVPDLALFYNWNIHMDLGKKAQSKYITITAREWLPHKKQTQYEKSLAKTIEFIWKNHGLKTVFLAMANNTIEDNDYEVARRIKKHLKIDNIFSISSVSQPKDAQNLLRDSFAAICTRLHSAILSTTVFTPFVTLAYTNKTQGFLDFFNLKEWNINMEHVNYESLVEKFEQLKSKQTYLAFIHTLRNKKAEVEQYRSLIHSELKLVLDSTSV